MWETLRSHVQGLHEARELALVKCRKLGQLSAKSIRCVHRKEFQEAESLLQQAKTLAEEARAIIGGHKELNPAYLHDTEKEMVEAAAVLAIARREDLPTQDALGAQTMAYLHGLCEAASEVRRFALDEMRHGRLAEAERILEVMEGVYEELIQFDYPDSLTNGLRRACDALRAVMERTRSDLTLTASQHELVEQLRRVKADT
jgi:translin